MLSGLFGEPENSFAVRTFLENVSLSVTEFVTCEGEFSLDAAEDLLEFPIFRTSLVDIS